MKIAWINKVLILGGYCIPFAFFAVNGDASYGTMMFYGLMLACFTFLCRWSLKTDNVAVLYIGNAMSFVSSYAVAKLSGMDPMSDYFKPFTFYSLIVLISVVALVMNTIIALIYKMKKRSRNI